MIAIVPAAGLGTRMASITGGSAKELLPLGSMPILRRVIREAATIGPREIVVVTSNAKATMNEAVLGWHEPGVRLAYQAQPAGLVDAILTAGTEDDAVVLNGDTLFSGSSPISGMARAISSGVDAAIAVQVVPEHLMSLYGIAELELGGTRVHRIIEKPTADQTPSRWAVAGRFAFSRQTLLFIADYSRRRRDDGREFSVSDALAAGLSQGFTLLAVPLDPGVRRIDCGSPEEYAEAKELTWD